MCNWLANLRRLSPRKLRLRRLRTRESRQKAASLVALYFLCFWAMMFGLELGTESFIGQRVAGSAAVARPNIGHMDPKGLIYTLRNRSLPLAMQAAQIACVFTFFFVMFELDEELHLDDAEQGNHHGPDSAIVSLEIQLHRLRDLGISLRSDDDLKSVLQHQSADLLERSPYYLLLEVMGGLHGTAYSDDVVYVPASRQGTESLALEMAVALAGLVNPATRITEVQARLRRLSSTIELTYRVNGTCRVATVPRDEGVFAEALIDRIANDAGPRSGDSRLLLGNVRSAAWLVATGPPSHAIELTALMADSCHWTVLPIAS